MVITQLMSSMSMSHPTMDAEFKSDTIKLCRLIAIAKDATGSSENSNEVLGIALRTCHSATETSQRLGFSGPTTLKGGPCGTYHL